MAARPQVGQFHGEIEAVNIVYGDTNPLYQGGPGLPDMRHVLSLFVDDLGVRLLSDEQINLLLQIRVSEKEMLFTAYSNLSAMVIAEFGSMLRIYGFARAYQILYNAITTGQFDLTWQNPDIQKEIEESRRVRDTETKVEARDDIGVCVDCGGVWIIQVIAQLRAADEPADVINTCAKCKSRRVRTK